jgi:hypothetical protein
MSHASPPHAACAAHVADLHRTAAQRRLASETNTARSWRERVLDLVRPASAAARRRQPAQSLSLMLATRPAPHH